MSRSRRPFRPALLTVGVVLIGLSLACVVWVRKEQRQYGLNRQLIAALQQHEFKRAITLVEAGADPNTHVKLSPMPTLPKLLGQLLHRSPPPANSSATALMMICGDHLVIENKVTHIQCYHLHDPHLTHLAQMMLIHGAQVNARDQYNETALMLASNYGLNDRVSLLLEHGVAIDLQDKEGFTALHRAVLANNMNQYESVKLLLNHHANPNLTNHYGMTPLHHVTTSYLAPDPVMARLLIQAGASLPLLSPTR